MARWRSAAIGALSWSRARHTFKSITAEGTTLKNQMRWRAAFMHEGWSSEQQATHAQLIATMFKQTQKTAVRPGSNISTGDA